MAFILEISRDYDGVLKMEGLVTKAEWKECAESPDIGFIRELDLSNADLEMTTVTSDIYNNYIVMRFPSSVNSIEANAFKGSALKSLHFDGVVESFGESAFADCKTLESIYLYNKDQGIITVDENWKNENTTNFTFYVNENVSLEETMHGHYVNEIAVYGSVIIEDNVFNYAEVSYKIKEEDAKAVLISQSEIRAKEGEKMTVIFKLLDNMMISQITVDGAVVAHKKNSDGTLEVDVDVIGNMVISVNVNASEYRKVEFNVNGEGLIKAYDETNKEIFTGEEVRSGSLVTFEFIPNEGYQFNRSNTIISGGTLVNSQDNKYTVSLQNSIVLSAAFEKITPKVNDKELSSLSLNEVKSIKLSGTWDNSDFATLVTLLSANKASLESITINVDCVILDGTILNGTFAGCANLTSFSNNLRSSNEINLISTFAGCTSLKGIDLRELNVVSTSGVFAGCESLRYVYINPSSKEIVGSSDDFEGVTPNVLIYTNGKYPSQWGEKNIISNGTAEKIELTHAEPFFCPETFTANHASYEREFTKKSGNGETAG